MPIAEQRQIMHEVIKTARRTIICDICGLPIQKDEKFRFIRQEYGKEIFFEHISCPKETPKDDAKHH